MEDRPIFRSLTRAPRWMGMERVPGALWVLGAGMLILTGLMYAGAFVSSALVAAAAAGGIAGLRRLGDHDPVFFQVAVRRLRYRDIYPARVPRRAARRVKPRGADTRDRHAPRLKTRLEPRLEPRLAPLETAKPLAVRAGLSAAPARKIRRAPSRRLGRNLCRNLCRIVNRSLYRAPLTRRRGTSPPKGGSDAGLS